MFGVQNKSLLKFRRKWQYIKFISMLYIMSTLKHFEKICFIWILKKYKNIQWQKSSTKIFIEKMKINVQWIMILKHNSRQMDQSLKNIHAQALLKQKCDHQGCKPTFPIKKKENNKIHMKTPTEYLHYQHIYFRVIYFFCNTSSHMI